MRNQVAIGLYSYESPRPTAEDFKQFYELAISAFKSVDIAPTYISLDGKGYTGKSTKLNGSAHQKAIKSGFVDIHYIGLQANPVDSDEPAYDSYASLGLSYLEPFNETLLVLAIEERFLQLGSNNFEGILASLIAVREWDFGYALSYANKSNPQFHVLGINDGNLSEDEYRSLCIWYAATPQERISKLRDIYPYNILSDKQLELKLSNGLTVREIILRYDGSQLKALGKRLWLWKVAPEKLREYRDILKKLGGLIC
jgi:hypothetical protein